MKYPYALSLALLFVGIACNPHHTFTLSGHLQGLKTGDTLRFNSYTLPFYDLISADTFVTTDNNDFRISIPAHHTTYGLLQYSPLNGKEMNGNSVEIIARPGDHIEIYGRIDYMRNAHRKGGLYDDPLVALYLDKANIIDSLRAFYKRKIFYFSASEQNDSLFFYIGKYQNMEQPKAYRKIRDSLTNFADNEYAAYMYLTLTHRKTPDELQTG